MAEQVKPRRPTLQEGRLLWMAAVMQAHGIRPPEDAQEMFLSFCAAVWPRAVAFEAFCQAAGLSVEPTEQEKMAANEAALAQVQALLPAPPSAPGG